MSKDNHGISSKHRGYAFTLNNPTPAHLAELAALGPHCEYLVYGNETAPQTGTPHLQGYIRFKSPRAFNPVKKLLPEGAHIEGARGTARQNIDYCTKDGDVFELGERPISSFREALAAPTDDKPASKHQRELLQCVEYAGDEGISNAVKRHPQLFIRYARLADVCRRLAEPEPRTSKPAVFWFYGETGSGKTRAVFDRFDVNCYFKMPGSKWFDGYEWQECCCIDDLREDDLPFHFLLRLLDRYPARVEVKGGSVEFNSPYVVVTAPFAPEVLFRNLIGEDLEQLIRRIDFVRQFPCSDPFKLE